MYVLMAGLALALLILALVLLSREKGRREQAGQLEELRRRLEEARAACSREETRQSRLRQGLNTIHLYAALSEEEARSADLREKQEEIRTLCESLLRDLDP